MPTFITPYSGTAELDASTGLQIIDQGLWQFSRSGYNDGATFGLSLGWPSTAYQGQYNYGAPPPSTWQSGRLLHLRAQGWTIAGIGNALTSYTDPVTHVTYPASLCRIQVTGRWDVRRQQNSNSFNGQGVDYRGSTQTDQGSREMQPWLLSYQSATATYVIQGSGVMGGAQDTFTDHVFECRVTEEASTDNSNYEFQSNTITRPVWAYTYSKSWQTSP